MLFIEYMTMKEIKTKHLVKSYKGRQVVNDVSLSIKNGEVIGLLGPNGAGKTTTFYMIVGLVRPTNGQVFLNDTDITSLPMFKRARLGIGYLPQEPSIFKKLTVEENLKLLLEIINPIEPDQFDERVDELITDLGLEHVRQSKGTNYLAVKNVV